MIDKRLKELREEFELSQKDLGEKLNVAASTIGMYESNRRTPDSNMLEKIADFFNVSVDYLLGRSSNRDTSIITGIYEDKPISIELQGKNIQLSNEEVQELINALAAVGFDVNKLLNKKN